MIILIIIVVSILFLIPFFDGWSGKHTFSRLYGVTYTEQTEQIEETEQTELDEYHELNKQERIEIADQTLVNYQKLIDNLAAQYANETNEKKKAAILSKQIVTLEKFNKALEKREKLDE